MNQFGIWHATHNNFLVTSMKKCLSIEEIKEKCKENNVDGIIFLSLKEKNLIIMRFYNPDGTLDNCGNGMMVAVKYFYNEGHIEKEGHIYSFRKKFGYFINKKYVKIEFNGVRKKKGLWNIGGVVHKVIRVNNFEEGKKQAEKLRREYNSNITLVKNYRLGIFAQTFEAGVENFTSSCGTGSVAASLETGNSTVFTPGGMLKIERENNRIFLIGSYDRIKKEKHEKE